jgi:endoglucanase
VAVWVTRESVGTIHQLTPYEAAAPYQPLSIVDPQAAVIEAHPSTGGFINGVNSGDGEGGFPELAATSPFSNINGGTYGVDYSYDTRATFRFLASRGIGMVRIPFRWERLQPQLYGPLDPTELNRLRTAVAAAESEGMQVILDLHNFSAYFQGDPVQGVGVRQALGSAELPGSALADFWNRMSAVFHADPGVLAYDVMNEPVAMPYTDTLTPSMNWESISQQVVNSVRAQGDTKMLMVAGYQWDGMEHFVANQPSAWIRDPAHNFRYEVHQYWDTDHTSRYLLTYDQEEQSLAGSGIYIPPVPDPAPAC